jgi:hypothetical protein
VDAYREYPDIHLESFLHQLLKMLPKAMAAFDANLWRPICKYLLHNYCDSSFWNLQVEFQATLREWCGAEAEQFVVELDSLTDPDVMAMIGTYELLLGLPDTPELNLRKLRIGQRLEMTETGRFWLIDRLIEAEPEQAFRLAKQSLRTTAGGPARSSIRDRLIRIHHRMDQFKQAASLSFIQFQEEPDFEEYRRLRAILAGYSGEWRNYLNRMYRLLQETNRIDLLVRIAIAEGNSQLVEEWLSAILADTRLTLITASFLGERFQPELLAL